MWSRERGDYREAPYLTVERHAKEIQKQLSDQRAELELVKQRLEDVNIKDSGKTREINILTDENNRLQEEVKQLKGKVESLKHPRAFNMFGYGEVRKERDQFEQQLADQQAAMQGLQDRVKELEEELRRKRRWSGSAPRHPTW